MAIVGLYIIGALFILAGVGMLAFPEVSRRLDEQRNARYGLQSHQGDEYESGLKMRAVFVIGVGVLILLVPFLAP